MLLTQVILDSKLHHWFVLYLGFLLPTSFPSWVSHKSATGLEGSVKVRVLLTSLDELVDLS